MATVLEMSFILYSKVCSIEFLRSICPYPGIGQPVRPPRVLECLPEMVSNQHEEQREPGIREHRHLIVQVVNRVVQRLTGKRWNESPFTGLVQNVENKLHDKEQEHERG